MDKHKHLEFIQNAINRMANNSFLLKGWAVTIITAIFYLSAKDSNHNYILISYLIIPFFWFLDGFFLSQERQFRGLYDFVRKLNEKEIDFSMDKSKYNNEKRTWFRSTFSLTLILFYIPLILVILVVMFIIIPHCT